MLEVNVKVAVRVRPLLSKELLDNEQSCIRVIPATNQLVVGKDRPFTFDFVFTPTTTQEDLYEKCAKPMVHSCFDGYNATVFAYGQTGSGKTYTMGGGDINLQTEQDFGIIPRAIHDLYEVMQATKDRVFKVKVSYIEIYKEELYDLLDLDTLRNDIHIREDQNGNTMVTGCTEVQCDNEEDVMSLLEQGTNYRHTAATQMNDHSSRSHSVFTLFIEQSWASEGESASESDHFICAKLSFVDLAGSERAHRTGNVGDRFKESIHINSGLLALGNVISALGDPKKKASHVPYRESKITRLLKDSLGGNSQTLMICCVSPAACNFDESLNALKYANRAKDIRNKPIVNRDPSSVRFEEMQTEIETLKQALERQKTTPDEQLCKDMNRLQTECGHYKLIAEEAYRHLLEINQRESLSNSVHVRLNDWLQLMEELKNSVPASLSQEAVTNRTVQQLKQQVAQYEKDLSSDEEIFAEKAKEINMLNDHIKELDAQNTSYQKKMEGLEKHVKELQQQLVTKQMIIEQMGEELKRLHQARPAASAPIHRSTAPTRNIHSSPAQFTWDRVVQGFRARSQILQDRLEDGDEVIQDPFTDDEEEDEDEASIQSNQAQTSSPMFVRNANKRLTYKLSHPQILTTTKSNTEGDILHVEDEKRQKLRQSELDVRHSTQKVRHLAINIKMKEQLIKELVKASKDAEAMNSQYRKKIENLQQEKESVEDELKRLQRALQEQPGNKDALEKEYKKKAERMTTLLKQQKDAECLAKMTAPDQKRIRNLERAVDKMKYQHDTLQSKLKDETQQRQKLQREVEKEQRHVKELQGITQRQEKVIKVKTQEVNAMHRRLRTSAVSGERSKLEEQKKYLDSEVERIVQQRQKMAELQKELERREEDLIKKEAFLAERSELEIKKLRSSQLMSKDQVDLGLQLEQLDKQLRLNNNQQLQSKRDKLQKNRESLDQRLRNGAVLNEHDERRLVELTEAIETLDATIDFRNQRIEAQEAELNRLMTGHQEHLSSWVSSLTTPEVQALILKYFDKVVDLHDTVRQKELEGQQLQMELQQLQRLISEQQSVLQNQALELDRQLTQQQQQYERKIHVLMNQLQTNQQSSSGNDKIQQLEKDLFYYKKSCRELKKKLRQLLSQSVDGGSLVNSVDSFQTSSSQHLDQNSVLDSLERRPLDH